MAHYSATILRSVSEPLWALATTHSSALYASPTYSLDLAHTTRAGGWPRRFFSPPTCSTTTSYSLHARSPRLCVLTLSQVRIAYFDAHHSVCLEEQYSRAQVCVAASTHALTSTHCMSLQRTAATS